VPEKLGCYNFDDFDRYQAGRGAAFQACNQLNRQPPQADRVVPPAGLQLMLSVPRHQNILSLRRALVEVFQLEPRRGGGGGCKRGRGGWALVERWR